MTSPHRLAMPFVRERLAAGDEVADQAWASTALILHDHTDVGPEALFIERASRRGDRWSGQMALPGGKRDPGDVDLVHTARREAAEEVGVRLDDPIGRLPDVGSRGRGGFISTIAFEVSSRPALTLETAEVAHAVWIPLAHLLDPVNAKRYRYKGIGNFSSVVFDRHVVWGLTYGILQQFAVLLDREIPRP